MLLKSKLISLEVHFVYAHVINTILFSSPRLDKIIVHFVLTLEKPVLFGESKKRRARSCQLKKINVITANIPLPESENQLLLKERSPRKDMKLHKHS